ncbi:TetR/AcrR family transcriptional regulator [Chelativorans salis]|uniref:TetR/AcrR family transcriptional regulator n=1 Tax=Chelativorans salis TaxID=2978478 RepID=A0ABT2LKC5_9HYPH|nr:TetR/AcrR family transcriptional regulator [Chelativorans sp. EGI FJ00035]MCT7375052.1 TetR/AcrR family transcriptional regulator [Chelativorans sp. EGI FJ00035]
MKFPTSPDILPPRGHPAKRQSIIDAAAAVFCREGFAGANIDLVAAEAGVSRQTVYNHHGDKEKLFAAVVADITERCNARAFTVLSTFPDNPEDLEADLTVFAMRLNKGCIWGRDGRFLAKLIHAEGERHPELFETWRREGPGRVWSALAARFARLAFAGHLDIDDPDLAARQFLALVNVDLHIPWLFGETLSEEEQSASAARAVRTFLRAYGRKCEAAADALEEAHQA